MIIIKLIDCDKIIEIKERDLKEALRKFGEFIRSKYNLGGDFVWVGGRRKERKKGSGFKKL